MEILSYWEMKKWNVVFAENNFLLLRIFALKIFQTTQFNAIVDMLYSVFPTPHKIIIW